MVRLGSRKTVEITAVVNCTTRWLQNRGNDYRAVRLGGRQTGEMTVRLGGRQTGEMTV